VRPDATGRRRRFKTADGSHVSSIKTEGGKIETISKDTVEKVLED